MRNWRLILVIISCILILIFAIIIFSVWSSVQPGNKVKNIGPSTGGTNERKWSKGGGRSGEENAPTSGHPRKNTSFISHTAGNATGGSVRDYTIPYKLPPTQEDEELWFDEIMKLNRLKPPGNGGGAGGAYANNTSTQPSANPDGTTTAAGSSSTRNIHQRLHFDSGNFRVQLATVWDPHPSYKFHAFTKDWRIDLVPSTNFVVPNFQITEHHENGNDTSRHAGGASSEIQGCFYTGVVHGDEKSSVAVSLCHGMTGHIRTSEGSYFIEPVGDWKGPHIPLQHVIYKLPSLPKVVHDDDLLPPPVVHQPIKDGAPGWILTEPTDKSIPERSGRVKRSMSKERHVELMVAADGTMANYHGPNLRHYILTLLHIVALVFRDASIGNPINIALVNLHILKNRDFARKSVSSGGNGTNHSGLSASDMLRNFCKWQKDMNDVDDNSRLHHDTALLLTRETICRNPWLGKCDTLGLAELGTMCDHYASCALVQDNGLSAAFTIAHELGHVMNMPHDDDHKCQSFSQGISGGSSSSSVGYAGPGRNNSSTGEHYVMSRMLDHNTYPWAWSKCSRHYLTEFLDAGHGFCLEDKPIVENLIMDTSITSNPSKQPGEIFSEHKQCQLVFGNESKLCSYMPVCRRLWCTHGGEADAEGCRTQHMPWADGTPCGESKWCLKGACVLKDLETLRIVDGGWGSWGDYGDCSRECGGGVRRSTRECDNPRPSNGGKYCTGPRVRYESCNTFECEGEVKDFRAEQCGAFNNDNFKIQGLPTDVQWIPKYTGIVPKDRCKLFCRVMGTSAYYLLKEKVIDGTPCGPEKFDICVNGACLPAGCDRRLHSKKLLDICGVCGGDGHTCHTESGFYNKSSYGYSNVVRIPAGASSIDIRQISSTSRDDNYLALLDPSTNEYLLNGNFVVSMFHKTVHASGTILEYSGSDSNTERINSSRPIQSDLIVQVLSVGKLTGPSIYYQFVINRANTGNQRKSAGPPYRISSSANSATTTSNVSPPVTQSYGGNYNWRISSFICSAECYGNTIPRHDCYRDDHIVTAHYCSHLNYPLMKGKYCNTHCKYSWKVYVKSECIIQSECGKGYKLNTFRCAIEYSNGTSTFLSDGDKKCEDAGETKPDDRETCHIPCDTPKWKYGAWGECDAICGDGWQVRSAACHFQNQMVAPHYCGGITNLTAEYGEDDGIVTSGSGKKLTIKRKCNERDCGEWKIDAWSPCSKTCGDGYSMAAYACYLKSTILPPNYCLTSPRPAVQRKCELPPCYHWVLGSYTCEQCGMNATKDIKCIVYSSGQDADDYKCDGIDRPNRSVYCGDCLLPEIAKLVSDDPPGYDPQQPDPAVYGEWIPLEYGKCTATDAGYRRKRKVTCSAKVCNAAVMPPTITECGLWSTGKWSECNATCGTGQEIRTVACTFEGKSSHPENCPLPVPNESRECIKSTKCHWKIGPWSKCSKVCGHGKRIRQVVCEGEECLEPRPDHMEDCNPDPCPLWLTGEWSECSSSCGGGVKERSVKCMDWDNHPVHDVKCRGLIKPNTTEPCAEWECGELNSIDDTYNYRWEVGHWTNCTKKCGKGTKTRDVNCTKLAYSTGRLLSKKIVPDSFCRTEKPKTKRGCARFPCAFKWISSAWSECSRECGFGLQERVVSCHRVNKYGWIDPDPLHACNEDEKPPSHNYCSLGDCNSDFRWKTESWSPCTAKCGKLMRQKRRVYCYNSRTRSRVNANNCKEIKKPNRKRKCPVVACGVTNCLDQPNGNTVLNVAGRNVTIYCHNGKEYINVIGEDNYSEVYEKRLIRPETCPRGGARLETCECVVDRNRKSGFTYFDKIRVNVTNLRVQADEFEFTRQFIGDPINYGEAGDCYSSDNCPQGRFSINLNGTGFVISAETEWGSTGHRASMWIHKSKDRNVIIGRCGGYCGSCYPLRPTGIKLQVL